MNPHSPTKPWLDGVATDENGYDHDATEDDRGTTVIERDGVLYAVTVDCLGKDDE